MQDLKTVRPLERILLKPKISSENSGTTYIETGMSQSVKSPYGLMVPEFKKNRNTCSQGSDNLFLLATL